MVNIALNSKHRNSFLLYQKFRKIPRLNKCRINLHNCLIFQLGYWYYWLFNHAWVRIYVLIAYFDGEVNKLTLNKRKETIETDWFNTLIDSSEQQVFLYTYSWSQPTQLQKCLAQTCTAFHINRKSTLQNAPEEQSVTNRLSRWYIANSSSATSMLSQSEAGND